MNARTAATVAAALAACSGLPLTASADEPIGGALPILSKGDGCGKATILKQMAAAGLDPMGDTAFPRGLAVLSALDDTDVTHVDLSIDTDFNNQAIAGTCVTDITSLVNGLTEYTFRLRSQFNVSSVLVDGVPAAWVTNSTTTKTVTLPVAKNAGESFQLTVVYDGQTVSGFFGSIEWVIPSLNQGPWWMNDNMVYTLSQPYYSYTWWPAKDGDVGEPCDYSDKFILDMHITSDNTYSSTATGMLTGVDNLPGNKNRYNFHSDYEIPTYLVAFATSDFNTYTQNWNYGNVTMPVEINLTQTNDTAQSRNGWFSVIPMLTAFSDRFGLYPWANEKYGIYEFGFGGGMEHQTNTGQLGYPPYTQLDWLNAHELMHQWFGDNVTCKTWNDIWLNEGFATYGEAVWEEVKGGVPQMLAYMNNDNHPGSVAGTVYVYDTTDANVIFDTDTVYLKAGWVVMMLRHKLGETAFNQAMQDFQAWYGQSGATTDEFTAAVIASTGVDITRFIDQWVYGAGAPIYRYGYRTDTVNGQDYLRLRVRQTQPGADGLGRAFQVPVDIRVNGTDDYIINNDEYTEHFVIPIPSNAASLALDPDGWILKRGASASEAYADGPPAVIATNATDADVTVTFIEPVNATSGNFSVVTDDGSNTPVPFSFNYVGASNTAELDFGGALPNGDYLVTVLDTLTSTAAGIALDGEGPTLPSGDGLPGGDYTFGFTVNNPCPADLNGDGVVDNGDIGVFIGLFLAQNLAADFNGDGIVDNGDIGGFIAAFLAGC